MKKMFFIFCIAHLSGDVCTQTITSARDPIAGQPVNGHQFQANPLNGNTYPSSCGPRGMNFPPPQNGTTVNRMYQYNADKIRGFKQTHQPSPLMNAWRC